MSFLSCVKFACFPFGRSYAGFPVNIYVLNSSWIFTFWD